MKTSGSPSDVLSVFVVGAAHIDRRAKADAPYRPAASNPGRFFDMPGGAAFNAAVTLDALGCAVVLQSARGGDSDGYRIAEAIAAHKFTDFSITWIDRATPTYTAILDDRSELVAGIADMGLYDLLVPRVFTRRHVRAAIDEADALLVDANLPSGSIDALAKAAGGRPIAAIGVSPAKVRRLQGAIRSLSALFLSHAEATSLVEASAGTSSRLLAEFLIELGARRAVITDGPGEVVVIDGEAIAFQEPPAVVPLDVTGAGDTLAAAALVALCEGHAWVDCVRAGLVGSSLRISVDPFPPRDFPRLIQEGAAVLPDPHFPERSL
ncbi:PfkB family carbohydrate kinase [Aurantimonas marina]|uniref:PfkB family carbohydrate kinase n=1 Tax=Aurantimonas marina TaxID=2780508 RepID=UPI0019D3067F|nr:PfkB family carbohydrate kinase [Aurantimonas marina]